MICWDCHWGWPKPVADIYDSALASAGGHEGLLEYGPAHIVWADENFDDHSIDWCIEHFVENADEWGLTEPERKTVLQSLLDMRALPESVRCVTPDDYDGEHPELYPPPEGVVMVRR